MRRTSSSRLRTLGVVVAALLTGAVALWWAVEMALVATSRYRLRHGDGREHSFKKAAKV